MAKRGGGSGRKYVRDNRGRFSSTGATARGGRLKTAGGKKRATQTVKAKTGGKPAGALKAKPKSEGQKYAGRVQAGKDLKRSQSVASQKKFLAKTQKRLDAAPLAQSRAARTSKAPTNSARATGKLTKPVAKGNIKRTGGRLGPKNTIKAGPKSPRTKMNRAINNVIKKGKALKGSAEKLRGVKKQADALRGRMLKEDKGRLGKALSKPSVTDKRSRDYGGRLTKGARGQDAATGGKKGNANIRNSEVSAKPAATKRKPKKVSADKVDRIIGRLRKDPSRKESIGMSSRATKSRNTRETRTRALDFINKAAGLKLKGKGSRPENPKGLDRGQMVSNIAGKLAKPTKRSTLKNNSKVVAQRQQVRKNSRESTASLRSSVKRQSRSTGTSYAPGRVRLMPPRVAAASGTRPFYTDNKGRIFSGRTSFGSTKASRQSKLQSVRKLRGTGGLGSSISQIKRSKASQRTIGGGTQTTFGKFRTGFQKRRRS